MSDNTQRDLTVTLPVADWQLVNAMLQQLLQPYQRLGQVLVEMQKQAMSQQQVPSEGVHAPRPRVLP